MNNKEASLSKLLASLPVPDATWEPAEPKTRPQHHPRGILRNASGAFPIVVLASQGLETQPEPPATTRTGVRRAS